MTQQGELFAPQPQPAAPKVQTSDEGEWSIAISHGSDWRIFSRDHRWLEPGSANEWAKAHLDEFMGQQWRVVLVEEFGKA